MPILEMNRNNFGEICENLNKVTVSLTVFISKTDRKKHMMRNFTKKRLTCRLYELSNDSFWLYIIACNCWNDRKLLIESSI